MAPEPKSYTGEHRYTLDEKGRVNIPAKFRKILPPANDNTFVVTKGLGKDSCIIVMPVEEWERIESNLKSQLNLLEESHRRFLRSQTRYASRCRFDAQGRITIPQNLIELTGLTKDVTIIGAMRWFEIWEPKALNDIMSKDTELSDKEMTALAEKIVL